MKSLYQWNYSIIEAAKVQIIL